MMKIWRLFVIGTVERLIRSRSLNLFIKLMFIGRRGREGGATINIHVRTAATERPK